MDEVTKNEIDDGSYTDDPRLADCVRIPAAPVVEPFGYLRIWDWPDVSPDFYFDKPTTVLLGTRVVPIYLSPQSPSGSPVGWGDDYPKDQSDD